MSERSVLEQKLHDEQLATKRCVAALGKVSAKARRRIVAWLAEEFGPSSPAEAESDQT